jgi:methylenetetrahydrofolate--tRNA-(uracil-5-)-methyltransferase
MKRVAIIGAGLAGSEAALTLSGFGVSCDVFEMRPGVMTPAHKTDLPAELVCSNSLKSKNLSAAHGVLKQELRLLGSRLLVLAERCSVPAGSALAVDRAQFSRLVLDALREAPGVTLHRAECAEPPDGYDCCIMAAGPLASQRLTSWVARAFSAESLFFYDAIAPIVAADSIDRSVAFTASRNESGDGDYLNCPFTEEEYRAFHAALVSADETVARSFEDARFF